MADARAKLKDEHRIFLVREMACFATPSEAVENLKERFDVDISRQAAAHYDPTHMGGKRKLRKEFKELFWQVRQAFLEDVEKSVPEAHKSVRIRNLAHAARQFKQRKNYIAMADMYERIAKELGNVHTNRHELSGPKGKPIQFQDVDNMTQEQIDEELRELGIDPAMIGITPQPGESETH